MVLFYQFKLNFTIWIEITARITKLGITNLKIANLKNIKNFDKTGRYIINFKIANLKNIKNFGKIDGYNFFWIFFTRLYWIIRMFSDTIYLSNYTQSKCICKLQ